MDKILIIKKIIKEIIIFKLITCFFIFIVYKKLIILYFKHKIKQEEYEKITKEEKTITEDESREIFENLKENNYLDNKGQVTVVMKQAIENGELNIPIKFESAKNDINNIILKSSMKLPINNSNKEVVVKLNKQVLVSEEFLELWEKVKYKTKYRFKLDEENYKVFVRSMFQQKL